MSKIFVRERTRVGKGEGRPRFVVVAVEGADLRFYAIHVRKAELEKLAADLGAELVYLPRGEKSGQEVEDEGGKGRRKRKQRSTE